MLLYILCHYSEKPWISPEEKSEHIQICRACYKVLAKFLEGDNRKNENYLARNIKFFQKQVMVYVTTDLHLLSIHFCSSFLWNTIWQTTHVHV